MVTSGNFSPELGHGIALAFVPPDVEIGDELAIDQRGSEAPATVVKPPFVQPTPQPVRPVNRRHRSLSGRTVVRSATRGGQLQNTLRSP